MGKISTKKRLGSLEDAEFEGFSWEGSNLKLDLRGSDYSSLLCTWACDLHISLSWKLGTAKAAGSLLSVRGTAKENSKGTVDLFIDFGSHGLLSVQCNEIIVME